MTMYAYILCPSKMTFCMYSKVVGVRCFSINNLSSSSHPKWTHWRCNGQSPRNQTESLLLRVLVVLVYSPRVGQNHRCDFWKYMENPLLIACNNSFSQVSHHPTGYDKLLPPTNRLVSLNSPTQHWWGWGGGFHFNMIIELHLCVF